MIRFFDASALLKRYVDEAGSVSVSRRFTPGGSAVARYSFVEVASAIARRTRAGDLARGEMRRAFDRMREDAAKVSVLELTEEVERRARSVLEAHPLGAGDALQLATALDLRDSTTGAFEFVCYDLRLNAAARAEGLRVRGARRTR